MVHVYCVTDVADYYSESCLWEALPPICCVVLLRLNQSLIYMANMTAIIRNSVVLSNSLYVYLQ